MAEPVAFGADGLTLPLSIPPFDGESVALWAKSEPGTCFTLASLEDAVGRTWVSGREAGPYCTDCAVRTSIAREEALIVLPSGEGFAPRDGFAVRFGLMDCETLTPVETEGEHQLQLAWLSRESLPERGRLSLRFLVSQHSMLLGQPDRQRELVERLNDELEEAGLEVTLDAVAELPDAPSETRFWTTDLAELSALLDRAPPALDATVEIVFAGCLRYDDPFFGPPVPVDGFTPRVGGGAGPASAVFMPGLRCDSFNRGPTPWPLDAYAHVLAHELGHFLGLYHSVETDGTTDLLRDTSEQNIMNPNPSRADARGWSPSQRRQILSHPWVLDALANVAHAVPNAGGRVPGMTPSGPTASPRVGAPCGYAWGHTESARRPSPLHPCLKGTGTRRHARAPFHPPARSLVLKLYYNPQSRATVSKWMLDECGAQYELVPISLEKREQKSPEFLKINPAGKLPALVDGDARVFENAAICLYLAEKFPEARLAPRIGDPQRGRYLSLMVYSTSQLEPAMGDSMMKLETPPPQRGWTDFETVQNVIEGELGAGPYLFGEWFTAADVMIGSMFIYRRAFGGKPERPKLEAYADRLLARPHALKLGR